MAMASFYGHVDEPPASRPADYTMASPANPPETTVSSNSRDNSTPEAPSMALRTRLALLVRVPTLPALCQGYHVHEVFVSDPMLGITHDARFIPSAARMKVNGKNLCSVCADWKLLISFLLPSTFINSSFIHLQIYFTTISVSQTTQRPIVGWYVNNDWERIRKEAVVVC
jgi:hypothetical protein